MKYNQDTLAYEYHSQVAIPAETKDEAKSPKEKCRTSKRKNKNGDKTKVSEMTICYDIVGVFLLV